jgi:hypothetical protein
MTACLAVKRARLTVLESTVTTVTIPGLTELFGIFVLGDGARLLRSGHTIIQLTSSDRLSTISGENDEQGKLKDGKGISTLFNGPCPLTVDKVSKMW